MQNNWNHFAIVSSYKHTCTIIPVAATSVTVLDKLYSSIGSGMLCVCCANGIFFSTTCTDAIVV